MASEPQPRYYEYLKSDMYPRIEFFQRMLSSLLPRFISITNLMDKCYVDKPRVTEIQSICKKLIDHPKIFILNSNKEFDMSRTVPLKRYFIPSVYKELDWKDIAWDDCLLTAVIYYYKGTEKEVCSNIFLHDLKRNVKTFLHEDREPTVTSHRIRQRETGPLSSLFIVCDIDSEQESDDIPTEKYIQIKEKMFRGNMSDKEHSKTEEKVAQSDIHRQLDLREYLQLSGIVNARYRLNVGCHVDIGCDVSTFFEDRVFLGFDMIDNFLLDLRKIDQTCFRISKSVIEDSRIVFSIDGLFCDLDLLIITMADQCILIEKNLSSKLNSKNIYITLIKVISFSLKSVVIQILWEKYGLCQILIHKCLIKVDFQREVENSLNSHKTLCDRVRSLFSRFNSSLSVRLDSDQELRQSRNSFTKVDSDQDFHTASHSKVKIKSKEEDIKALTADIVLCLKGSIHKCEEEVVRVNKVVELAKKMNFEISGYYKRAKLRNHKNRPTLPYSRDLQSELLSLNDVIGCGFIYSVFEILVKDQSEDEVIEDTIQNIIHKYRYFGQYTIKRVRVTKSGELGFTHHGLYVKG